ncbi:hypothetical protein BDZ45DRAFT_672036 [Acephala macrosclerotiorum]|nr:hypothetical protein BDZ45DRAFT_672036 [Acephala macrosclerotiorum]
MLFLLVALSGLISGAVAQSPFPILITGNHSTIQDTCLIKRTSDNLCFRFSLFDGIQTATAPSLLGPWENIGPTFPGKTSNDLIAH